MCLCVIVCALSQRRPFKKKIFPFTTGFFHSFIWFLERSEDHHTRLIDFSLFFFFTRISVVIFLSKHYKCYGDWLYSCFFLKKKPFTAARKHVFCRLFKWFVMKSLVTSWLSDDWFFFFFYSCSWLLVNRSTSCLGASCLLLLSSKCSVVVVDE